MKILFIDRSTKILNVNELQQRPRGGTINSLFKVSDYLARAGHLVDVFTDIATPGMRKMARWINELDCDTYDVLICNRGVGDGYPMIKAKKRILWTHDLPHNGFIPDPNTARAFYTVFMSKYSRDQWRYFFKTINNYTVIPNGVTPTSSLKDMPKDLRKVVYFSHPNRGLDKMALIADAVNSRMGEEVKFRAYANTSMYPNEPCMAKVKEFNQSYESDHNLEIREPLKEKDLAIEVSKAGLMVMPTSIPETCSNSVLQALALGVPVITTGNLGSVHEWVKHKKNGMLTKYLPNDYMVYTVEMVRNIIDVLSNERLHLKMIQNAKNTNLLTWNEVGRAWEKLITR